MSAPLDLLAQQYTANDLVEMPEEGVLRELIRGSVRQKPPAAGTQGILSGLVALYAGGFIRTNRLGVFFGAKTGFLLGRNPDTVLAPDWAFVAAGRMPASGTSVHLEVVPDIVLEVRSPTTSARMAQDKILMWLARGVKAAWDLDPAGRTLTVYRLGQELRILSEGDELTEEVLLPGFSLPLRELFAEEGE